MNINQILNSEKFHLFTGVTLILLVISPLLYIGEKAIIGDGNILLQRLEAMRQTIIVFHQWPSLNIWNAGGQPLEGHAGIFPISIKGLFVLLFGTQQGLNITIILYVISGYIGSWLLASIFWKNSLIRNSFALLLLVNLPLLFHLSAGHIIFYVYYLFPLLLFYFLKFSDDKWAGIKAGIVFSLAFNDTPAYLLQYISITILLMYFFFIVTSDSHGRQMLFRWLILFSLMVLTFTSYHAITIYQIGNEFPRISDLIFHYSWPDLLRSYFYPFTEIERVFITPPGVSGGSCSQSTHEIAAYLGIIGFILVVLSLNDGVRWWHTLILFLFFAGIGNDGLISPMYWLQKLPSFSSHLCFSRVRVITHLFLPFAMTGGLWLLWSRLHLKKYGRSIVIIIGIALILERLIIGFMIVKDTHLSFENADPFYSSHLQYNNRDVGFINVSILPPFEATQLNIGILRGGGDSNIPMNNIDIDGYFGPIGEDEKGYVAEFHQNSQIIEPDFWSPNKIIFSKLDPRVPLTLNLNPSSAWYNNDIQLFPDYKIVEVNKKFEVMPNVNGSILLKYEFPGRRLGILVMSVFFVLSIFIISYFRRRDNRADINSAE